GVLLRALAADRGLHRGARRAAHRRETGTFAGGVRDQGARGHAAAPRGRGAAVGTAATRPPPAGLIPLRVGGIECRRPGVPHSNSRPNANTSRREVMRWRTFAIVALVLGLASSGCSGGSSSDDDRTPP